MSIDDGLEIIMWIRCLGGQRLPTASYALRPNLNKLFFSPRREERSRFSVVCFLHTSRRHTFDRDTEYTHGQRASCRARPVNTTSEISCGSMFYRGREVARDVLRSLAEPENAYFLPSDMDRVFFVICFLHNSGQFFSSQTPGRRPPYITGLLVNCVT